MFPWYRSPLTTAQHPYITNSTYCQIHHLRAVRIPSIPIPQEQHRHQPNHPTLHQPTTMKNLPTQHIHQHMPRTSTLETTLRVVVVNFRSVKGDGKPAQLKNIVSSLQADLVLGTESWLSDQVNSAEVFPDGYTVFRRDRHRSSGGGVFILVSK
jgi:hypothetical protein